MRVFLKVMARILVLALCGGMVWTLWYVNTKGFTKSWRNRVQAEFLKHGIVTDIRRLTLDPFRGLTANDVAIYRSPERRQTVALVHQVTLDINYAELIRGRAFLSAVDLRGTRLDLPVIEGERDVTLTVADLDARIAFPPGQIRVSQLDCRIFGVGLNATGTLLLPADYTPAFDAGDGPVDAPWIEPLVNALESLEFPGEPPGLTLSFTGDIRSIESLVIDNARLRSGPVVFGSARIESVDAVIDYMDKRLDLRRLAARDTRGELLATGGFSFDARAGAFEVLSTLDLQPLLAEVFDFQPLRELTFFTEPRIQATVDIALDRDDPLKLLLSTSAREIGVRSIVFDSLDARLAWQGGRLFVPRFLLAHESGTLEAEFLREADGLRARVTSTLDPKALVPLLDRKSILMLNEWEFTEPPTLTLEGGGPDMAGFQASGTVRLGPSSYRGVDLIGATSRIEIADRRVTYRDFHIRRAEGEGRGTFTYDFGAGEARLENVVSTMDPDKVAQWIDPEFVDDVLPYRFRSPARVRADGVVKLGGSLGTRITLRIAGSDGMDYTFLGKDLPIEDVSGTLTIEDYTLRLNDFEGRLFGGRVDLDATISVDPDDPVYSCSIRLENADFPSITGLYFDYTDSQGLLSGTYTFRGRDTDPARMSGSGEVVVLNGDVFRIPFLGPVSSLLNTIVPGMGYSVADRARASFTVDDGVISTDDFEVISEAFTMTGGGDILFIEDRLDFDIRINAKGLPGILLFPVSKLFEYTADGALDDPGWRPKILPAPGEPGGGAASGGARALPIEPLRIEPREPQRRNPNQR